MFDTGKVIVRLRAALRPGSVDKSLVQQLAADLSTVEENDGPPDELSAAYARLMKYSDEDIDPGRATGILTNNVAEDWARETLYIHQIRPVEDVTRAELVEVLRRAYPGVTRDEARRRAYMAIFQTNVPLPGAWNLMFWPPASRDGRISSYDPTPEQIVAWIFDPNDASLLD